MLGSLVDAVIEEAGRRGHSLVLYVDNRDGDLLRARYRDVPHVIVRPVWFRFRLLTFLFLLGRRAQRDHVDVLVSHSLTAPGPFRRVVYVYDILFERYPEYFTLPERMLFRATRWSAGRADRLLALSKFTRDELVAFRYADRGRITVVYPGVPRRKEAAHIPSAATQAGRYFLYVGRLNRRKNIPVLIEAASVVLRANPECSLLLVGGRDGSRSDLRIPPDLSGRIRFLGWLPDEELPALYRGATAVVYPSRAEGFGLPVLEALQYGVPVIASGGSALEEAAGDAGLRVDPDNPADIARAMQRILSEPGLVEYLRSRAPAQLSRFSWEVAAQRLCDACEESVRKEL